MKCEKCGKEYKSKMFHWFTCDNPSQTNEAEVVEDGETPKV
jgi:hypothetical protein